MSLGVYRHSLFGETRLWAENEQKIMEVKVEASTVTRWLTEQEANKNYSWYHCLTCRSFKTEEERDLSTKKKMKKVTTVAPRLS